MANSCPHGYPGAIRKNRCLGAGFLFSHTPADNRRFPTLPSQGERPCPSANPANGDIQRRPHSNRGIASRRSGPRSRTSSSRSKANAAMGGVIRTAEDFKSLERAIAVLTNRLSALLMAEATQVALDDTENRHQARSLAQGVGHTIKDQGRRDVTLRTTSLGSDRFLQPIMPLDLPVRVRPWEIDCLPT